MKRLFFPGIALLMIAAGCTSNDIEKRIDEVLPQLTLEEKVKMLHAQSKFSSAGVPRLGIPELWCSDGPHGVRAELLWDSWSQAKWTSDSCTAFPALTCLAATWNEEMSAIYGKAIGEEARYRKKNVLLGPGVNIYRTPLNGRNFEYMGEDPYLASRLVVPYIQELQKGGVAACVKHYALNNQENRRHTVNVSLSDRALYEIYLPAFKAAVQEGGAWSVMGSYNLYQHEWACQNQRLLVDILRGEWGFDGAVISDWGAVNNTVEAALKGVDLEFGSWTDGLTWGADNAYDNYYLARPYLEKIKSGELPLAGLDEKVRNVLRLNFRTAHSPFGGSLATQEHFDVARRIAQEGIVLLKNDGGLLPVRPESGAKILVVGDNATHPMTVGGGSSGLKAQHETSPLDGMKSAYGCVDYARGYGAPGLMEEAVQKAAKADVVFVFGGLNKDGGQDCEGRDRESFGLPYGQDELVEAIVDVNPNVVFVNISGNAVEMPWAGSVKAIVQGWYLGSEAGSALADVLSGAVNPSGKLPFTFYKTLEQCGAFNFGEAAYNDTDEVAYLEDIFVGYRWTEKMGQEPLFPFGHGLSYTTFEYGDLRVKGIGGASLSKNGKLTLSLEVRNSGECDGAEVVQLYIEDKESSVERPVKELKGFRKVFLKAGESTKVEFTIDASALSFFDEASHSFVAESGEFIAHAGASSADIRTSLSFRLR